MYKILSWIAVIIWMAVIFNLSAQVAEQSNQLSTNVTEVVVKTVETVAPKAEIDIRSLNNVIRKNAHFFSYLLLGVLVMNAFRRSGITIYKSIIFSFIVCVLYAASDEIHQMYVPDRGAQIKDVLIDSSGVVIGLLIYWFIGLIFRLKHWQHVPCDANQ